MLWLYVFALVQLTRLSQHRRSAYPRRFSVLRPDGDASASPEEVPLGCANCGEIVGTYEITSVLHTRQSGGCISFLVFLGSAARRGKGISDSAAADLIASNAPLREGTHKARQNPVPH